MVVGEWKERGLQSPSGDSLFSDLMIVRWIERRKERSQSPNGDSVVSDSS